MLHFGIFYTRTCYRKYAKIVSAQQILKAGLSSVIRQLHTATSWHGTTASCIPGVAVLAVLALAAIVAVLTAIATLTAETRVSAVSVTE